ncbi:cytochrome c [Mesorhizobium sp. BR1-1-16]|uniref:c-type cytochrome n=1 Tax=Mesorhizobium sp. BR1-1-16 TaxID=2876653 RepID=UPI001CCB1746|nr:cytochrome c [Mesorhizobium sp. BR1-1-16]MBZ9934949.1 cytochrome c [Mesorhizobium sp. BR1-1-16]
MRKIIAVIGFTVAVASAGLAMAASDLGKQREADMKAIGGAIKTSAGFAMGKVPFDAAAAKAAMETVAAKATDFPTLFPAGSETADKGASPKIWENKADFEAHAAKLASDAKAAAAAADQGADAFKAAFAVVGANCKSCHQLYRLSD